MEMVCFSTRVLADVGQIRPRTNQEGLAPHRHAPGQHANVSAPGMAFASLLRIFPSANRLHQESGFHECERNAPTRVQQSCYPTTGPILGREGSQVDDTRLIPVLQAELARRPAPPIWVDGHNT